MQTNLSITWARRQRGRRWRVGLKPGGYRRSFLPYGICSAALGPRVVSRAQETISADLEDFLSMKRMAFPRFYFLSNDELLEILARAKNVHAVQPHIQKCFDGIKRLEFCSDGGSVTITAMLSAEGEVRAEAAPRNPRAARERERARAVVCARRAARQPQSRARSASHWEAP